MMHSSENVKIFNITSVNIDSARGVVVYVDGMLSFCEELSVGIDH
jgi:hypothetical protein